VYHISVQLILVFVSDIIGRIKQRISQNPVLEGQREKNLKIYVRRWRERLQKICKLLEMFNEVF